MTHGLQTERGRYWSLQQVALVGLSTLGAVSYIAAMHAASHHGVDPATWLLALGPVAMVKVGDSAWPLAYWGLLLLLWTQVTDAGVFSWWSPAGAAGLVVAHAATALGASAPPGAEFPPRTRRAWLTRTGAAAVAAAVTAASVRALTGHADGLASVAYVVGLLGVAGFLWFTRSQPPAATD